MAGAVIVIKGRDRRSRGKAQFPVLGTPASGVEKEIVLSRRAVLQCESSPWHVFACWRRLAVVLFVDIRTQSIASFCRFEKTCFRVLPAQQR